MTIDVAGHANGSGTAVAQGFGGPVAVTVTVAGGKITEVVAEGADETAGSGSIAIDKLPKSIVAANSLEVDAITGATVSSNAVLAAAEQAYAIAKNQENDAAPPIMAPGIYTNSAWAFSVRKKMEVSVLVDEKRILDIHVGENGETMPILKNAKELLIPRIIGSQSIAVDAISGATSSSNGIKAAAALGLRQALAKGGSPASAMQSFMKAPSKATGAAETLDCDILVIGMGGTGAAAAMSAAESQKSKGRPVSVLAIDKAGKYGGTSSVTSEMMAINPPRFMKEHGCEVASYQLGTFPRPLDDVRQDKQTYVDRAELKKEWLDYTCGDAKEELIDLMLDNSGHTLDWLQYKHGFFFGKPQFGVEPSAHYYLVYQYNGSYMDNKHVISGYFDQIWHDFESLGGRYMLETEACALIVDGSGRVSGATARRYDGAEYQINAKAVILGTGGFAGNNRMTTELLQEDLFPLKGAWRLVGMHQNDGKMIQAALDCGAGAYNISVPPIVHIGGPRYYYHAFETTSAKMDRQKSDEVDFNTTVKRVEGEEIIALDDVPMIMALSGNVLSVNRYGKRFCDEWGLAFLQPWRGGVEFYSLWSQDQVDKVRAEGFDFVSTGSFVSQGGVPVRYPIPNIDDVVGKAIEMGEARKADSIEALAAELGIDPAALRDTVDAYNEYCRAGEDLEFGKDARYLRLLGQGPYYAFLGAPYCYSTTGGLNVNAKLQVLKTDGMTPVPGLYAAGTDCLGTLLTEKNAYVTYGGLAQGWAFTSGQLAGENAVADIG
jgi:fumarate reductase flavoprotein subunit